MTTAAPLPGNSVRGSRTGRPVMALLGRRGTLRLLWELREAGVVELAEAGYGLTPRGLALVRHLKPLNRWAEAWASQAHLMS